MRDRAVGIEETGMLQFILTRAVALCFAMLCLAGIVFESASVNAHDWYPIECCARSDCMPARGIERDGRGGMTTTVEDLRIAIPESLAPRISQDNRIHVCFRTFANEVDGNVIVRPICLFLPAEV